jgi:seryl-tRNA synthetase
MVDPKLIREAPQYIEKSTNNKNVDPVIVEKWLKIDKKRSLAIVALGGLRHERNQLTEKFKLKKPTLKQAKDAKSLREKIQKQEKELKKLEKEWNELLMLIPNPSKKDVPVGKDDKANVELNREGDPPEFDFEPKSYLELGEMHDIIDIESASKMSGPRFGILKNDAALLELALVNYAIGFLAKKGFKPIIPPTLIKKEMEQGLGYADHGGWKDMYVLDEDNLVLVATAEHALVSMNSGRVFNSSELPERLVGFSSCFRRESGSYGKDAGGILRVHQFDKVEMVSFCKPEDSEEEHDLLVSLEEELMMSLGLHYRLMLLSTGDSSAPSARTVDVETWMPSENKFRETHSCSNCTDFQARRLNIKFKDDGNSLEYVHILNGTAFAIGRMIIMILENFQQKDGRIKIPKPLIPWVGKEYIDNFAGK